MGFHGVVFLLKEWVFMVFANSLGLEKSERVITIRMLEHVASAETLSQWDSNSDYYNL